jgi:hypothetical protein
MTVALGVRLIRRRRCQVCCRIDVGFPQPYVESARIDAEALSDRRFRVPGWGDAYDVIAELLWKGCGMLSIQPDLLVNKPDLMSANPAPASIGTRVSGKTHTIDKLNQAEPERMNNECLGHHVRSCSPTRTPRQNGPRPSRPVGRGSRRHRVLHRHPPERRHPPVARRSWSKWSCPLFWCGRATTCHVRVERVSDSRSRNSWTYLHQHVSICPDRRSTQSAELKNTRNTSRSDALARARVAHVLPLYAAGRDIDTQRRDF